MVGMTVVSVIISGERARSWLIVPGPHSCSRNVTREWPAAYVHNV
jgi:hypothetical protein